MELLDKAKTSNDFGLRKRFPWSDSAQSLPWMQTVTNPSEITFVKNLVRSSVSAHCLRSHQLAFNYSTGFNLTIKRVENPYLWARYVLNHEEMEANLTYAPAERYVLHVTSLGNAVNIADVNFDWRLVNRARFGKGVSFATNGLYGFRYASCSEAYIITGIPVGKVISGNFTTLIPPADYDTTSDSRGYVYVKYYDNDFYPYYIVH